MDERRAEKLLGGPAGLVVAELDRATGLGWAGGYVGDGVATTNLEPAGGG